MPRKWSCKDFFSVGQHCILCAKEAEARGYSGRLILASLLHDASECYMSDVPRPFKKSLPEYRKQEEALLNIIYQKYLGSGLSAIEEQKLKEIDNDLLWYDLKYLLNETPTLQTGCPCSDPIPAIPFFTGRRGISKPF